MQGSVLAVIGLTPHGGAQYGHTVWVVVTKGCGFVEALW